MKAVILAGGLGTRLRPHTTFLPKPMLPLGEKPILEHLVEWVGNNGIGSVVLCVSYLRRIIEDYFEDGRSFGLDIEYAVSNKPLATAGQLKTAEGLIGDDEAFVCMYGDSIYDFNLRGMIRQHRRQKAFVTMGLHEYETRLPYGVIETAPRTGRVTAWKEKPAIKANINMGCYAMSSGVLDMIPEGVPYGMDDVIAQSIKKRKRVDSFLTRGGFLDIGTKSSYKRALDDYTKRLGKI